MVLLLLLALLPLGLGRKCSDREDNLILKKVMTGYDKAILPQPKGVLVVQIKFEDVELHIQEISHISELKSEFEVDVLFSSIWHDPGLDFEPLGPCQRNLTLDLEWKDKIWSPNTCIINSKSASIHRSPSANIMLILYQNGTVWQNFRMRVRGPCDIDLRDFPFDTQTCSLTIESYSFNSRKVKLRWYPAAPVTIMKATDLPDFHLRDWHTRHFTTIYPNGAWDELVVTFTFDRAFGFFILQAYIPTFMTVCVAYMSFFMDTRQVSARATLGISSFLAMTLQFGNIIKNQPRVSYIKALDVWMIAGILFMFFTLAELAVISYMQRGNTILTEAERALLGDADTGQRLAAVNTDPRVDGGVGGSEQRAGEVMGGCCPGAVWVDGICRAAFPLLFLSFNVAYWGYFLGPWRGAKD